MITDEFYISVSSTDSLDIYPSNTVFNFTHKLPREISLDDRWRVALVEILHPRWKGSLSIFTPHVRPRVFAGDYERLLSHTHITEDGLEGDKLISHRIKGPVYCRLGDLTLNSLKFKLNLQQAAQTKDDNTEVILILHLKEMEPESVSTPFILCSDASKNIYPSNTASSFQNILATTKYYEKGMYEIALCEFSYVSFEKRMGYLVPLWDNENNEAHADFDDLSFVFMAGESLEDFATIVTAKAKEIASENPLIKKINHWEVENGELFRKEMSVVVSKNRYEGFNLDMDQETKDWIYERQSNPLINKVVNVTCSAVEPSVIGSNYSPSLRLITLNQYKHRSFTIRFDSPYYVPLADTELSSFTIKLQDRRGEEVNLGPGVLYLYLDVRKRFQET